jgi:hypothetical protein
MIALTVDIQQSWTPRRFAVIIQPHEKEELLALSEDRIGISLVKVLRFRPKMRLAVEGLEEGDLGPTPYLASDCVHVLEYKLGFPHRSLQFQSEAQHGALTPTLKHCLPVFGNRVLPYQFRVAGAILNALEWAALATLLGFVMRRLRHRLHRLRRDAGLCPYCKYPRTGSIRCSECGLLCLTDHPVSAPVHVE